MKNTKNNPLFTTALLPKGNGKLLDFDDVENGIAYRYAQVNTRAVLDCPFRSRGCERVCYATKGNHVFPSVKDSRERSHAETLRADFSDAMIYTIQYYKTTRRYKNAVMIVRIHESGDFYSVQYLRKWIQIWKASEQIDGVQFTTYTKSFPFLLMLTDAEKAIVNRLMTSGKLTINFSTDDTTNTTQKLAYLDCIRSFPRANTYTCTEHVDDVEHTDVCDCADCAKCGTCNHADGKRTVVKIHSASNADMQEYRKNITA